jgi:hypothetical protein
MTTQDVEISVKGQTVRVTSVCIDGRIVIVQGRWLRMASVRGEEWMEGDAVRDPELFITQLKNGPLQADVLTFAQKLPITKPSYSYPMEWDNAAAIPITTYKDWWEGRLPQVARKNVRRAQKRGVAVKAVKFDDELVNGIVGIFNESPIRQGRPFTHYGKSFETVKNEISTMLDRSEFIGAYHDGELIGYVKLVYMGKVASILNIVSKSQHYDKRPTNALIAEAVKTCEAKGVAYLVYGKYAYGNKTNSPLAEFKGRNGFEQVPFPRYYIPLTVRGAIATRLKLYRGLTGMLPGSVISFLVGVRSTFYRAILPLRVARAASGIGGEASKGEEPGDVEPKGET